LAADAEALLFAANLPVAAFPQKYILRKVIFR